MSYLNTYQRSPATFAPDAHLTTPPETYDYNFVFPVKLLSSDRVELRPFVPSVHAQLLYDGIAKYPEVTRWLPMQDGSFSDVLALAETMRRNPATLMHAIYTDAPGPDTPKTDPKDYVFAGVMSCINASYDDMTAEPGYIIILPPFQRTHVLTHAAGTLMHRILDPESLGGLGLRRCQWYTTTLNEASQRASLRLGYTYEGTQRAAKVLPLGKEGIRPGRKGDYKQEHMTRDTWGASIIWEEWEEKVRDHVDALMARRR
ncbi:hypothetical protein EHS25_010202 [Saitozyma podzolica]|uniref:N-acetyltransferase domain-containing protein n=1 Tax=Saitozyma podzolica TaxID=1890683 RepID=A0A427YIW0_9TREE|nr:hypothetical protein EHS25_010202 [Saitozyma podzolica]